MFQFLFNKKGSSEIYAKYFWGNRDLAAEDNGMFLFSSNCCQIVDGWMSGAAILIKEKKRNHFWFVKVKFMKYFEAYINKFLFQDDHQRVSLNS